MNTTAPNPPSTDLETELAEFEADTLPPAIAPAERATPMFKRALASVRDELLAMDDKRLVAVNVDLPAATTLVLGAVRDIRSFRPAMVARFGEEMASQVDRLELLARAVGQAHARHRAALGDGDIQPLATSASELRAALLAEVHSLAARKRLVLRELGPLRGGSGFKNIGFDVLQLVAFLTDQWDGIENATGYTIEELEAGEGLANQLITAVGVREQAGRSPTADIRQRAFSLLSETYDDVRQMMTFLRWKQGDADRIAPSWFRGRKPQRAALDDATGTNAPAAGGEIDVRPGMPGAPPFVGE